MPRFARIHRSAVALVLAVATRAARGSAQESPAGGSTSLPPLRITATREGPRSSLDVPYALSSVRPHGLAAARRLALDELLFAVPGVALANRQNPSQDPRISIRGFGARSAFGVRGVRVLQDGIPVTLADGQTPVDVIDLEGAERVEVIRGSASSLYGNAAGGVVDIRSAAPTPSFQPGARIVGGSSTPTVTAATARGPLGALGASSSLTRVSGAGFRRYSDQRMTRGAARLAWPGAGTAGDTHWTLGARYEDVARAESPGALTLAQFEADPTQADPLSVRKRAGKTVRQGDLSLSASRQWRGIALDAAAWGSHRALENPLIFAIVDLARESGGVTVRAGDALPLDGSRARRLSAGADVQWQNDDRREYANCFGTPCAGGITGRGALRRSQRERVSSVGPFARVELALTPAVVASAGVRADAVHFRVLDRLVSATDPDDSGERTLRAISPSAGVVVHLSSSATVYANLSTAFETPTTTELGNRPDGTAGVNPEVQPQRTLSLEGGTKGVVPRTPLRWDLAVFAARVRDELVPFDLPDGRRYYRNAGRTQRSGAELALELATGTLAVRSAYTYSCFRYTEYTVGSVSYAGRQIPGIAPSTLQTTASFVAGDVTLWATNDLATGAFVDDANSARAPGRALLALGLSGVVRMAGAYGRPIVALHNVFDGRTVGAVNVNAAGGKFYEPAPGRTLLIGLSLARREQR